MTIQEKVAESLSNCGDLVVNTVVNAIVTAKVNERALIVSKAITKLQDLDKELKKVDGKTDAVYYDKGGIKVETMSQKRYEDIQRLKLNIQTLNDTLEKALNDNTEESYAKLNGQFGGNKPEDKSATAI